MITPRLTNAARTLRVILGMALSPCETGCLSTGGPSIEEGPENDWDRRVDCPTFDSKKLYLIVSNFTTSNFPYLLGKDGPASRLCSQLTISSKKGLVSRLKIKLQCGRGLFLQRYVSTRCICAGAGLSLSGSRVVQR